MDLTSISTLFQSDLMQARTTIHLRASFALRISTAFPDTLKKGSTPETWLLKEFQKFLSVPSLTKITQM